MTERLRQHMTHCRQPRSTFQWNDQRFTSTPPSLLLNCRTTTKKRHVYEHTGGLQAAPHTSNQHRPVGGEGGNTMFTTESDDWVLISHSTLQGISLIAKDRQTWQVIARCCRKWHAVKLCTDTPPSAHYSTFSFHSKPSASHCDTWWKGWVAFNKINLTLTILNMSA